MFDGGRDWSAGNGEIAALLRRRDGSRSPLGAMATWPPSVRTVLRLMLASR